MQFKLESLFFKDAPPELFTELTAPTWLSSVNTVPGSTMDMRWFFEEHVLILEVGEHIDTDFSRITRIK